MLKDQKLANQVLRELLEASEKINNSIIKVMNGSSNEEFVIYRKAAGKIMGELFCEVLRPIYKEHPNLESLVLGDRKPSES